MLEVIQAIRDVVIVVCLITLTIMVVLVGRVFLVMYGKVLDIHSTLKTWVSALRNPVQGILAIGRRQSLRKARSR